MIFYYLWRLYLAVIISFLIDFLNCSLEINLRYKNTDRYAQQSATSGTGHFWPTPIQISRLISNLCRNVISQSQFGKEAMKAV